MVGWEDMLSGVAAISQVDGGQGADISSSRRNIVNSIKESNYNMTTWNMDCQSLRCAR